MSTDRNIVIIGAGIIGCSTAYYLSRHPSFSLTTTITILEASRNGAAQGASGKAGGLVAKWAYPKELVAVSFSEHVKLAEEHNGVERWGWRFVGCGCWEGRGELVGDTRTKVGKGGEWKSLGKINGLEGEENKLTKKRTDLGLPEDLLWVKEDLTDSYSPMAGDGATAQVHPYLFTTSMLDLAKEKGVKFISGKATSINRSNGKVTGVTYSQSGTPAHTSETIPATDIILAAGVWSPGLLPTLPISATLGNSVTIRPLPSTTIAPYVLFTEITLPQSSANQAGETVSPEIYARPDNEVYVCGPGSDSVVPDTVDDVVVDQAACESIREHVASISQELRDGTVEKQQACFIPVVSTGGGPVVGEAKNIAKGLFIATGHTCWGICNGQSANSLWRGKYNVRI